MNLAAVYKQSPCKDCVPPRRNPGCHCKDKVAFEELIKEVKMTINENKQNDCEYLSYRKKENSLVNRKWR